MLWVSELTVARWPPCADVLDSALRHLVFIYIYGVTYRGVLRWNCATRCCGYSR